MPPLGALETSRPGVQGWELWGSGLKGCTWRTPSMAICQIQSDLQREDGRALPGRQRIGAM
jgi:hypothetical protein